MADDLFDDNKKYDDLDDFYHSDDFNAMDDFGGGGSPPIEKHNDLLKQLTEFNPFLKQMVSEWMGMVWDEETSTYKAHVGIKPVMNIQGARWCVNQMRVYARNNNIITDIEEKIFKEIMEDIVDTVYLNIGTRAEEFGIESEGDIILVANQLIHTAELVLIGAGGVNNYKDLLQVTTQRNESVNVTPNQPQQNQQQKLNWLDKMRVKLR